MNRRDFLMRLGAGLIGALVVRPSVDITDIFKPTQRQIDFLYGGAAGNGKTFAIIHPNQMKEYYKILGEIIVTNPRHNGVISNIEDKTWGNLTRSQEAFFKS